jgi:DNA-directed RNA polymerase specialized sigma24 family protein
LNGQATPVDEGEFLDCYELVARDLVGFFARRTGDPQLAMDLLGATFLAAFEQRARCRGEDPGSACRVGVSDRGQQAR